MSPFPEPPMRIVHIIAPSPYGGAEQVVDDLTRELVSLGTDVHLIVILDVGVRHPWMDRNGAVAPLHPLHLPPRAYRAERAGVRRLLDELDPDLVHTHGYRADVLHGDMARREGIPRLSTVHGFTGGGWKNRLYERLQTRALRGFEGVIAVSSALERELAQRGVSPERIHMLPNARRPHPDPLGRDEARARLGLPHEGFQIGWVGRLSPEKGPDILLAALAHLEPRTSAHWGLTFIGDGQLRQSLEARARTGDFTSRVHWAGALPDAARYLAAFDLVVLSSRTEGTPLVAIEAMQAGVPLLATRVGGVPDLVRDGALAELVAPEDPEALARAINGLMRHPDEARAKATATRDIALEALDPGRWAEAHVSLYRRCIEERGDR